MTTWRFDDRDLREIEHDLFLVSFGGARGAPAAKERLPEHVESLLGEVRELQGEVESMVDQADHAAKVAELEEERAAGEAFERDVRRVFGAIAEDPLLAGVVLAPDVGAQGGDCWRARQEERASALAVACRVVPLFELLRDAHAAARQKAERVARLTVRYAQLYTAGEMVDRLRTAGMDAEVPAGRARDAKLELARRLAVRDAY